MPSDKSKTGNTGLDRGIGLSAALANGIGTMVGAGIFVFPGLVAQGAGELGLLSFLLAGAVAPVVAFYTSELATSMPQSAGGYAFSRRVFERFHGPQAPRNVRIAESLKKVTSLRRLSRQNTRLPWNDCR